MAYRRNEVVDAMVTAIETIAVGSEYSIAYRKVTRDPIANEHVDKLTGGEVMAGVYDIGEEKERNFGSTTANLTVVVEFYYKSKIGEGKSSRLNIILAELTKALTADQSLDGTSLMITDVSNNIDIDGIYDKIINGSITFHVKYRHGNFDPTKAIC